MGFHSSFFLSLIFFFLGDWDFLHHIQLLDPILTSTTLFFFLLPFLAFFRTPSLSFLCLMVYVHLSRSLRARRTRVQETSLNTDLSITRTHLESGLLVPPPSLSLYVVFNERSFSFCLSGTRESLSPSLPSSSPSSLFSTAT